LFSYPFGRARRSHDLSLGATCLPAVATWAKAGAEWEGRSLGIAAVWPARHSHKCNEGDGWVDHGDECVLTFMILMDKPWSYYRFSLCLGSGTMVFLPSPHPHTKKAGCFKTPSFFN